MKKFKLFGVFGLLAILFCLSFSSCSDDDEHVGSASDLIGTWESVHFVGWYKVDGEIVEDYDEDDNTLKVVFNADGTYELYERWSNDANWGTPELGTWTYKKGTLTTRYVDEYDGEVYENSGPVKELTANRLVLEEYSKEKEDGSVLESFSQVTYRKVVNE